MNVVHVHNEIINKGGTEVYLAQLQKVLPQYGYSTHWLGVSDSDDWKISFDNKQWSKAESKADLKRSIVKWVKLNKIELICIHNLFDDELTDLLLSLCPVIKFSHSPVLVCPGRDKFFRYSNKPCTIPFGLHCFWHVYSEGCSNRHPKRIIKSWTYVRNELGRAKNRYRKVIVMSTYNCDRLIECGVPHSRIAVIPYFTPYKSSKTEISAQRDHIRLLFIGRLVSGKGVFEMIDAVEPILREAPNVTLHIIGDGPLREKAEALSASRQLGEAITFWGWKSREEIEDFIDISYLVIFPSTYPESFGIVGIEAMMAAKPVVAFDVGGVSTWLANNESGFLVPVGNVEQMRQSVRLLISDKTLYERVARRAREIAISEFLPEVHLNKLDTVFRTAIIEPKLEIPLG